jgi:hypothetical protein
MENRKDSAADKPEATPSRGDTVSQQGMTTRQERVPRQPHELDESADQQPREEPSASRVGQAAHDSLEQGHMDTTKGAELDRTYDKVREGTPDPEKKFAP